MKSFGACRQSRRWPGKFHRYAEYWHLLNGRAVFFASDFASRHSEQKRKRYLELYGIDINGHSDFDVTINTEMLTASQVSGLIVATATRARENTLDRKSRHLPRMREIITENLRLAAAALSDPRVSVEIKAVFADYNKSRRTK